MELWVSWFRRPGFGVVTVAGAEPVAATRDGATPLLQALARGHRWLRMLETGDAASMCDIARRESTNHSYVARHINLTLLAPDIVAAILDESLPEGVQLLSLAISPPMLWVDQRRLRAGMVSWGQSSLPMFNISHGSVHGIAASQCVRLTPPLM